MKNLIIFPLIIYSFITYSQGQKPMVDGIGPFKIGKTLCSTLPANADTTSGRLKKYEPEIPNTELWYAGYYPIADMWIQDLKLTFYKDTLYSIECSWSPELSDALDLKFGKPKSELTKKNIICRSGAGVQFTETETTLRSDYPTIRKNISATVSLLTYFDSKCNKKNMSYYLITNTTIDRKIKKINELAESEKLDKDNKQRIKKLADF